MYSYILQDWTTIRGTSNTVPIVQNEADWLGFSSFQDIAFWIDIREFTNTGGGNITLNLQTAPTKDEVLFQTMTNCSITVGLATPVTPLPTCILASGPATPMSTWVRWSLIYSVANSWDVTFRIIASANRVLA